ncbi:MAG: hypothetical protein M3R45_15820 [Pseudomonadota bacterium]|nr:hypothetical protein [Pseudomonadota bacterium]
MKYLLILALALVVVWLWRHNRQAEKDAAVPPPRRPAGPGQVPAVTEMVACSVCQMHLPRSEALIGREGGVYCSEAHRREAGG